MELSDFLALLRLESGPNASGEYMCRCPVHDDKTASLCVTEGPLERGKNRGAWAIKICCQAGCSNDNIMRALGVKPRDLFPASHADPARNPSPAKPAAKPAAKSPAKKRKPLGDLTKVYTYTDENGKALFEVCRFERIEAGDDGQEVRKKTFLQRVHDPKNPLAKHDGYVYEASDVRHPLYRLPEVLAAIKAGRKVYLVEGEKDADNLAALGFTATTNPGGASKKGMAVKWREEHTEALTGADVVILPDIDETGTCDRRKVARLLLPVCHSVKLLDLRKSGVELPDKADITDLFTVAKKKRGLEILQQLEDGEPVLTMEALDALEKAAGTGGEEADDPDRDKAVEAVNSIPGYCVEDGCICKWESEESHRKLCNFLCLPMAEVKKDDGVNVETAMLIEGWNRDGMRLPRVMVSSKSYERMGWVMDNWGFFGNIMPGSTVKDNLRYVVAAAGEKCAKRYTEYNHTGWRKIAGKWAYLYQGGAVGADNVSVELGSGLQRFRLDGDGSPDFDAILLDDAMIASYGLLDRASHHMMVPLLAAAYLAPLREPMQRAGCTPAFSVFLVGETSCGKSVCSALALSHFGHFTYDTLPASFHDTANHTQKKAFLLKDVPIVVDDYHPTHSIQERRKMEATAQALSRTFGDGSTRKRMNADRTLSEDTPPRCVSILSGESTPDIGESGVARYYLVNVEKGDVPMDDMLTSAQECARRGYYAKAMRGYIEWLIPQMDQLPDQLRDRFLELRGKAQREGSKKAHKRAPGAVACLMIGFDMMLQYMVDKGGISQAMADEASAHAWEVMLENSSRQAEESAEERPSRAFVRTLGEMLTSHVAAVRDLTDSTLNSDPARGMVGWMDAQYYYIMPETAYTLVSEQLRKRDNSIPLPERSLYRQMRTDGIITPPPGCVTYSFPKRVRPGKPSERVLYIPRRMIDGEDPKEEQLRMETRPPAPEPRPPEGYTQVDDVESPF